MPGDKIEFVEPFQSAPPRGGRPESEGGNVRTTQVSIRAPAWGATRPGCTSASCPNKFQSAPPRGGRHDKRRIIGDPHRGPCFNPRPRVGGDRPRFCTSSMDSLFQSAPPRGGRLGSSAVLANGRVVSIRAPAWGATSQADRRGGPLTQMFQSAPPRGGRPSCGGP